MKFFEWVIRIIYWVQAFAATVILFGVIAVVIYVNNGNKTILIVLLTIGGVTGVIVAELIRRKYGLEKFFSSIYGSGNLNKKNGEIK